MDGIIWLFKTFKRYFSIFWILTKSIFLRALDPWKTLSDGRIKDPRDDLSIPGKSKNLQFVDLDLIWCLWTLYVCSMDMGHALWTWDMSSCGRRICAVWIWNMWIWKMSSCGRRIYGYGRCLLVERTICSVDMEDVFLLKNNIPLT